MAATPHQQASALHSVPNQLEMWAWPTHGLVQGRGEDFLAFTRYQLTNNFCLQKHNKLCRQHTADHTRSPAGPSPPCTPAFPIPH